MIPHLFFYQLAVLGLLWLCVMLHAAWPSRCATVPPTNAASTASTRSSTSCESSTRACYSARCRVGAASASLNAGRRSRWPAQWTAEASRGIGTPRRYATEGWTVIRRRARASLSARAGSCCLADALAIVDCESTAPSHPKRWPCRGCPGAGPLGTQRLHSPTSSAR